MKKVLMTASVASMIDVFNQDNIDILQNDFGYEVHIACNFENGSMTSQTRVDEFRKELEHKGIKTYHIPIPRSVLAIKDIVKSHRLIKKIFKVNRFEIIHCHSPIGSVVTRFASKNQRKYGTKVIYTAHGFHFFEGAPKRNWLLYYNIEKALSRYTDILITINEEDYKRACNKLKAGLIKYIPGAGIDTNKFFKTSINIEKIRQEIGIPNDAFLILSVGELNKNKNHEVIINAMARLNNSNIYYIICGQGSLDGYLVNLAKQLGLINRVKLLGFRNDIAELCKASNIFAFPSKREGLGIAALEAMASGLPIVTSNIHGIVDYSINGETGYNCKSDDINGFAEAIQKLMENEELRFSMGLRNMEIVKKFDKENVKNKMKQIYKNAK